MKYLLHKNGEIIDTYEQDLEVKLTYPGHQSIPIDDETYDKIKTNPGKYTYKDGKVVLLA